MCFKLPKFLDIKVTIENKKRFVEILLIVMSIMVAFSELKSSPIIRTSSILFITLAIIYYGLLISEHKKLKKVNKYFTLFTSLLFSSTLSGNIIISIISNEVAWTFYAILFWVYYLCLTFFIYKVLNAREK